MQPGRPAKPLEIRVREGNPGKRALPEMTTIGVAPLDVPEPPESLESAGLAIWDKIWVSASWLGLSDEPAVVLTCEISDQIASLKKTYSATKNPQLKLQWFWAIQKTQKELLSAYSQLGLTPVARARLGLTVAQAQAEESRLTKFTNRRNAS